MRKKHRKVYVYPFSFPEAAAPIPSSVLVSTPTRSSRRSRRSRSPTVHSTDLIIKILSKLPVKSICRFKSVSKLWLKLISDPYFVAMHAELSLQNPKILAIETINRSKDDTRIDLCSFKLDGTCENYSGFSLEMWEDEDNVKLVSSGYGLICFGSKTDFYACNPSKREMFRLPSVSTCCDACNENEDSGGGYSEDEREVCELSYDIGMGFVKETNEYVFVHLFHDEDEEWRKEICCEVLRLRDGEYCKWELIDLKLPSPVQGSGVLVENVFYWMRNDIGRGIVSLDLVKKEFGSISSPNDVYGDLEELKGSLCLVNNNREGIIDIWVMKDNVNHEWIMEYKIDITEYGSPWSLDISDYSTGRIWIRMDGHGLVYYDIEKNRIVETGHPILKNSTWLLLYTESLFSIGSGRRRR